VYDDCNGSVQGANVVASFSNGDLPLTMFPDPDVNLYTVVWQPGSVSPTTTVAFSANLGDLATGGAGTGNGTVPRDAGASVVTGDGSVTGEVTTNPSPAPPPFLNACGTVNNTNVVRANLGCGVRGRLIRQQSGRWEDGSLAEPRGNRVVGNVERGLCVR
jgi:hypothetical protein